MNREADVIIERDVAIPMRDGTLLRANIFRPRGGERVPALLNRTPYGKAVAADPNLVSAGYAVVYQDIRGRCASDGQWIPFSESDTGDGRDGYDTIEWIAGRPWCTGKVGTFGQSYDAWVQWQAAMERPPHLLAMSAVSIPTELTTLDYPGSFRLARRLHWWFATMAGDVRRRDGWPRPHTAAEGRAVWHDLEQGLRLGTLPVAAVVRALPPSLAKYAEAWMREPQRRPWRFEERHKDVTVPNLDITGWYDHCSSLRHFTSMRQSAGSASARRHTRMVIGPWHHNSIGRRVVGPVDFGEAAAFDVTALRLRWFDHWLKGMDNGVTDEPALRYFVLGSGVWKDADGWPAGSGEMMTLHLAPGGRLVGPGEQGEPSGADAYTYDPADPVPTLWDEKLVPVPSDRRKLDHRTDVLRYRSEALAADVEVVGEALVCLRASSSALDTDFFVHLVDEDPAGMALEIAHGMVRARHRHGLERNDPIVPGEIVEYSIRLCPTACRFRAEHRIRLEITSSSFPHYARNHNTGGNDLFESAFAIATQTIFHSSQLCLPVR